MFSGAHKLAAQGAGTKIWGAQTGALELGGARTGYRFVRGKIISKYRDWGFLTCSWQSNFPSRLLWTKAAYDYMYASGETLLRNFPVQATIQVIDDYDDSDDDDDDEEVEEECGEQETTKKCKQ